MKLCERWGVALKTERGNRVFPVSDHAADIIDALFFELRPNLASTPEALDAIKRELTQIIGDGAIRRAVCHDGHPAQVGRLARDDRAPPFVELGRARERSEHRFLLPPQSRYPALAFSSPAQILR